ncbi:MAG: sulfurtransferase TusA family protein [Candidatus Bipolaricaulia bacterium]
MDRELDLSGEICPYTFVKSKLVLEELEDGQILRVFVDYEPASRSVPRSMTAEGHQVLAVDKVEDGWTIVVQKRESGFEGTKRMEEVSGNDDQ